MLCEGDKTSYQEDNMKKIIISEDEEDETDLEEDDGTRLMTRKERIEYDKQVFDSDGFEVKAIPRVFEIGQIQPCDLNIVDGICEHALGCAKGAVDFFNHSPYKIDEGELDFDKLVMATSQIVCGVLFYLTFTAKNAKEGRIITYQSEVVWGGEPQLQVLSFRRKPAAGADKNRKKWIWSINRRNDSYGV